MRQRLADIVIFLLIAGVIFCAAMALSSLPPPVNQLVQQEHCEKSNAKHNQSDNWKCFWKRTTADPVSFFTLILVLIGGAQAYLFLRQLRFIRIGLADTKKSADAAEASANTAANSFARLERPDLYVSEVGSQFTVDRNSPIGNPEVFIIYSVANHGKIPAIITEGAAILKAFRYSGDRDVLSDEKPTPFDHGHPLVIAPIIPPGDTRRDIREYTVMGTVLGSVVEGWFAPATGAYEDVFLWITLTYRGPFTEGHETSACLRWDSASARWVKHHTNNYEK